MLRFILLVALLPLAAFFGANGMLLAASVCGGTAAVMFLATELSEDEDAA